MSRKAHIKQFDRLYSVDKYLLYYWLINSLRDQNDDDIFTFQFPDFFKLINKSPLSNRSKIKNNEYCFLDQTVWAVKEKLKQLSKELGKSNHLL